MSGGDPCAPRLEVDACEGDGVVPRLQVVGLDRVAAVFARPVVRGDVGLEGEGAIGGCRGLGDPGELEDALDVRTVGRAGVGEVVEAVVALVGQRDAALVDDGHVTGRVARVGLDEEGQQAADPVALEFADEPEERGDVGDAVDALELRGERLATGGLDAVGVHEAREQVADLAGFAARLGVLRLLDDGAHVRLGLLGDEVERAQRALSSGISVRSSQLPFTWRNRSSCGRISSLSSSSARPERGMSVMETG